MNQSQETQEKTPKTRGDCPKERPCPHVRCKYHMLIDMPLKRTMPIVNGAFVVEDEEEEGGLGIDLSKSGTCALDYAEEGGMTLEAVAAAMGLTRERVRQIEADGINMMRRPIDFLLNDKKSRDGFKEYQKPHLSGDDVSIDHKIMDRALMDFIPKSPSVTFIDGESASKSIMEEIRNLEKLIAKRRR